jgi:hypothetical protein
VQCQQLQPEAAVVGGSTQQVRLLTFAAATSSAVMGGCMPQRQLLSFWAMHLQAKHQVCQLCQDHALLFAVASICHSVTVFLCLLLWSVKAGSRGHWVLADLLAQPPIVGQIDP